MHLQSICLRQFEIKFWYDIENCEIYLKKLKNKPIFGGHNRGAFILNKYVKLTWKSSKNKLIFGGHDQGASDGLKLHLTEWNIVV